MVLYQKELSLAIDLAKNASKITEWFKQKGFKTFQKKDESPVTLADITAQIYVLHNIKAHFPDDQIIAEEGDVSFIDKSAEKTIKKCFKAVGFDCTSNFKELVMYRGKNSEKQWTIDPIDGTLSFTKGLSYSIGIGLMVRSEPKICVIFVPNYKEKESATFYAEENKGANIIYGKESTTIRVSEQKNLKKSKLVHSLHFNKPWVDKFAELVGIKERIPNDSMIIFCRIADGSADFCLKPIDVDQAFSWDYMPGSLLIKEAGGEITDLKGFPIKSKDDKFNCPTPGFIISNGFLHKEIIEIIKKNRIISELK